MPEKTDIIRIEIPSNIEKSIREADNIPQSVKLQIEDKVRDGKLKIDKNKKKRHSVKDVDKKCEIIFEILQDRKSSGTYTTISEILEITEIPSNKSSAFMLTFNKYVKKKGSSLKKIKKKKGRTSYILTD